MKNIHPVALCGLLLNAAFIYLLSELVPYMDASMLSEQEQQMVALVPDMIPNLLLYLGIQAVGLALIEKKIRFGYLVALVGTMFMLPVSLVFGVGCLFGFYNQKNTGLPALNVPLLLAERKFPSSLTMPLAISGGALAVCGYLLFTGSNNPVGVGLLFFGIMNCALAYRAYITPPLVLFDTFMSITPNFMARPVMLSYSAITKAELKPKKIMQLTVTIDGQEKLIAWPLSLLMTTDQKTALAALAKIFRANQVELK